MKESNKNNPFKTPEGYFEDFNDRLFDKLSKADSILPKKEGFVVPEKYFDSVHDNILEKLQSQKPKVVQLNPYRKYYYAVASIAAIVLLVFGLTFNTEQKTTFDSLAASDIEDYFETNEYDLTAYEIAEVIPFDELEINDMITNRFEDENVLDYLNENIEDFESFNIDDNE